MLSDEGVYYLANNCKHLKYFSINTPSGCISEKAIKMLVNSNPHLRRLSINCCSVSDSFIEFLGEHNSSDLSSVDFQRNIDHISFTSIAKLILKCISLTHFQVTTKSLFANYGLEFNKKSEQGDFKTVRFGAFNIDNTQSYNNNFQQFVSKITDFDQVQFSYSPPLEITSLERLLKFSPNIRELSLHDKDKSDLTGEQVSYLLANSPLLTVFNCGSLSNSEILHVFTNKNDVTHVSFLFHSEVTTTTIIQMITLNKQLTFVHCVSCPLVVLIEVQAYITENGCEVEITEEHREQYDFFN
jgi:hypothetical protein